MFYFGGCGLVGEWLGHGFGRCSGLGWVGVVGWADVISWVGVVG